MQKAALSGIVHGMKGALKIRKIQTASGATAVQIIRYANGKRHVEQHVGSAHTEDEITVLLDKAERLCEELDCQPSLFAQPSSSRLMHMDHLSLNAVTHQFAYQALRKCSALCGLAKLPDLYQDLALMRIIEPTSKLRTIELLAKYFNVIYAERTVYRLLASLVKHKAAIEQAAYDTAEQQFSETFALVLYDVTTLYFESHKPDDELLARGFSKDDKSKQPQIVIGLLVTPEGFPLMHEVFKGNTFEGHTMLDLVKAFQSKQPKTKPIIVADAAMLSQENMQKLEDEGYHYIVGARLANATHSFIKTLTEEITNEDGAVLRIPYPKRHYEVICTYSEKRYKKDKYQLDKHIARAKRLIEKKEPGKRAKFIKKSGEEDNPYLFDEVLKEKTQKLLGIKGYCTNIPEDVLPNTEIVKHYQSLWHVEQAFRMSKTDLKTRPIFHYAHDAVKAHVLLCFMALMMGKFLEIKTGLSLRRIRDILWDVHEAHIEDSLTGKKIILKTNLKNYLDSGLDEILKPH